MHVLVTADENSCEMLFLQRVPKIILAHRRVQTSQTAVAIVLEASVVCIRRGGVIRDPEIGAS